MSCSPPGRYSARGEDDDAAGRGACHQPQAGAAADAQDRHCRARPEAADDEAGARAQDIPVSAGALSASIDRTRSGAPISPTSRSAAASFTSWRSWPGRAGRCWLGGCPTLWTARSASRRWKRHSRVLASQDIFNTDQGSQFTSAAFTGTLI
jgi:hypothetical protein